VAGSGGTAPAEFTWSMGTPCPLPRFEANGVVIDGELWVLGGFTGSNLAVTRRVDIYDPAGDSWRLGPELPSAETHIAVVALGSDIVIAGGFVGAFTNSRPPPTDAVFRLNAGMTEWTPGPALPNASAAFAWALMGTELHLAGGLFVDGNTDAPYHYVWDTAAAATWSMAAELPIPRNHGGGAATGGIFYAIAGRHEWDEVAGNVVNVDAFDPASGTWTARAPLPVGRSEIGASTSTLSDGRILVVGGSVNGKMPSDDVYVYDPSKDEWASLPKLPEKRKGAVALQIGSRIVVTTGSPTSTDPVGTTFIGCCL
jgi:N-acetylneuraminic acid mutarotase